MADRFDALISKAKKGKVEEDESANKFDALIPPKIKSSSSSTDVNLREEVERPNKFDALIPVKPIVDLSWRESFSDETPTDDRFVKVNAGSSPLFSSKSSASQSEKSTLKVKSALSMNATTGGGKGRFDSLRKRDDLGRSLHGRVKFVDDLGQSLGKDSVTGKSMLETTGDKPPPNRPSMMRSQSETNMGGRSNPFDALIPKSNKHENNDTYSGNIKTNPFDELIPKFTTNAGDDLSTSKHGASPKAQPTPEQARLLIVIRETENLLQENEERHASITNEIKVIMKRGEAVPRPLRSLRDDLEDEIPVLQETLRTHRQQLDALVLKSTTNTVEIDRFSEMVRSAQSSSGNDELSNSKHGSVAKAQVDDREALLLDNDELNSSKHGSVAKAQVNDRLQGGDKFDAMVRAARSSTGNDELSNSKHGSVAKAQVNDRLQGGDRFDSMVRAARSSTGNDELSNSKHGSVAKASVNDRLVDVVQSIDKFDSLVIKARSGNDELSNSKHGSVAKAHVEDRGARLSSDNDELGNSKHGSVAKSSVNDRGARLAGNDDLGSSKHGNVTKDLVLDRYDLLVSKL